jgi:hypothetical protein
MLKSARKFSEIEFLRTSHRANPTKLIRFREYSNKNIKIIKSKL